MDLFTDKFGDLADYLCGDLRVPEPPLLELKNSDEAIDMLNKHIKNRSKVLLFSDVDMDGIGSSSVTYHFLSSVGLSGCIKPVINKEREHGLTAEKHIDYINNKAKPDLLIVVDSSSNAISIIEQLNCDVLVIDHHNMDTSITGLGNTSTGEYVIISNILSGLSKDMSACLVCYELFRLWEVKTGITSALKTQLLYQIVAVTLFSDAILLGNMRNQWYIQNTLCNFNMNITLKTILGILSKYDQYLTKTTIQFKLVPVFNKAIRANQTSKALNTFLLNPASCGDLIEFSKEQTAVIERNFNNFDIRDNIVFSNLDNTDTHSNYTGVVAQGLVDEHNKTSIAFKRKNNIYTGSFRGLCSRVDYRKALSDIGVYAEGHDCAFGIRFEYSQLQSIKEVVAKLEKDYSPTYAISIGCIGGDIELGSFEELRKGGNLYRLAQINKNLSTSEHLLIKVPKYLINNSVYKEKYSTHTIGDFECISFERSLSDFVCLYVEFTDRVRLFLSNIK